MLESCNHKKIKKNYPFGRKSKAQKVCTDCGEVVTNKMIKDRRKNAKLKRTNL